MRKRLAILGVSGVALAATTWFFIGRETPMSAARELLDCAKRLDTACLHRRMTRDEKADAVATKENLNRFLQTVVGPRLAGFEPSAAPAYTQQTDHQGWVEQPLKHRDGREVIMAFAVVQTADGIFCNALVRQLLNPCVMSTTPAGEVQPRGPAKSALWADCLESWLPALDATGIVGASTGKMAGGLRISSWRDMIATFREMSKPREQHHPGDGGVSPR